MILQNKSFEAHLQNLKNDYEKVIFVNLIDKKKDQKNLGDVFQTVASGKSDFVWFDFHAECKNMNYGNLSKLFKIKEISDGINHSNFTYVKTSPGFKFSFKNNDSFNIIQSQSGVYRVNCIDSLDRSNVVQTVLMREITKEMIPIFHAIKINQEKNEFLAPFESLYKNTWANNGDQLAMSYSGTNALKGDFTRFGKKSIKGTLLDGVYSVKRYFINNFGDGYNQDAHDYSIGVLTNFKNLKVQNHSNLYLNVLIGFILMMSYYLYKYTVGSMKTENESFLRSFVRICAFVLIVFVTGKFILSKNKKKIIDNSTIYFEK